MFLYVSGFIIYCSILSDMFCCYVREGSLLIDPSSKFLVKLYGCLLLLFWFMLFVHALVLLFKLTLFLCRAVGIEFDDLNTKSREAEKEVNMLQIKIQEVNNSLSKHRKDMECKHYSKLQKKSTFQYFFRILQVLMWWWWSCYAKELGWTLHLSGNSPT